MSEEQSNQAELAALANMQDASNRRAAHVLGLDYVGPSSDEDHENNTDTDKEQS